MSRARVPIEGVCPEPSIAKVLNCGHRCVVVGGLGGRCQLESDIDIYSDISLIGPDAASTDEPVEINTEGVIHTMPLTNKRMKAEALQGQGKVAVKQRMVNFVPKISA